MPADHEYFKNINLTQWVWYNHQAIKDDDDHMTDIRDMIEYHASFLEPGMVSKVVKERTKASSENNIVAGTTDDTTFNESIKRLFGRDPGITGGRAPEQQEMHKIDGALDAMSDYQDRQDLERQNYTPYNYKYWANIGLE